MVFAVDKMVLHDMYIVQHMRIIDIAKAYGFLSSDPIRRELKRHGIKIRKRGSGFNVKKEFVPSTEQYNFFDGLIASDGSICRRNKLANRYSQGNDFLSCAFKYKEFAEYIKNYLELTQKVTKKVHKSERYKSGECTQYGILSSANTFYTKERDRWYPKGTKVVPKNFRFCPVSMNIFYLSDGTLNKNTIYLCTQSFTKKNLEDTLIRWIKEIDIECWATKDNQICIPSRCVNKFLCFVGECPVDCYKYKWKAKEIEI